MRDQKIVPPFPTTRHWATISTYVHKALLSLGLDILSFLRHKISDKSNARKNISKPIIQALVILEFMNVESVFRFYV